MRQGLPALRRITVKTKHIKSRFLLLILVCLGMLCLTACQGRTLADSYWSSAKKEKDLAEYIEKNWAALDVEGLRGEADSAETLGQQFKAITLLCGAEHGANIEPDESEDGSRAREFLAKVLTEENFWEAFEEAFYPYDCFTFLFEAAGQMDREVLMKLLKEVPADAKYADEFRDAVDTWIEDNPVSLTDMGDELISMGYFDDWSEQDWTQTYLYSYVEADPVKAATIEEALAYVSCLRESVLPAMEGKFGADAFKGTADITGAECYATQLAVVAGEELSLKAQTAEGVPENIETEGKKVIAFYRNPASAEWEGSPAPLRILGDFMLNLPAESYPASLDEADYYLVLTPSYEYGSFYSDRTTGEDTGIQEIWSSTSIDLYEAGTGNYLRHLGNIMEEASSSIVSHYGEEALEYPVLTSSDILYYIYSNVNSPEAYVSLVDQTGGRTEFEREEAVILGSWEVTYHSSQISKSFESGLSKYEASEGCQLVRASFTIKNVGLQKESFMSYSLPGTRVNIQVGIADAGFENYFEPAEIWAYSASLNNTSLEPGETEDGELIFEVPDSLIESPDGLYIVLLNGYQMVAYPLGD